MDRMLRMVMNRVLGPLIRRGVDTGLDLTARARAGSDDLTPEQKASLRQSKKRTKQAMRTARRFGRF